MFGQAPSTPFGAPATPFGSPAPAPFGQQPTSSPFGQAPAAPSVFGQPAAAPSAFGAATSTFGQPAAAPSAFGQAPSAFGGASAFGQPAAAPSVFGQPAQQTTSVFGQPAQAPSGGLFGAPAPAPSAFGAPAFGVSKPLFGGGAPAPAPTGLFGAPAPAPSTGLFGAPAPAPTGGLFGAPATPFGQSPAPSAFGAPAQPSAFGTPAPFGAAPAAGGFGAPMQQTSGTASTPFTTTSKNDGSNTIILQSITGMPQFEHKSFEELRLEDYAAGNKGTKGMAGPAAPVAGGFGGFGAAPQPAPAFGQPAAAPAGGLFGSPAPAPAGGLFGAPAPAPSAFGQPAAAPAPLFGAAPAQASGGLFGSAPTPAPAFGAPAPAFGAAPAPATGGLFGSAAPAPTGGLFGAAPAPATGGLFGAPAPAPATGGLFGTPAPAPAGGLFGAPAPAAGGLFGATPAPAPTGGLFGAPAPAPSGGLFGATATPVRPGGLFGAPAPAGGLFGAPAPAPTGGLFGSPAPAPAGGLFGAPAPAPIGGLFGAPAPAPAGGLFGAPVAAAPVAPAPSAEALLAQQLAAVENQKKQLELVQAWSGNVSPGSRVVPSSYYDNDLGDGWNGSGGSYATSSSALLSLRPLPRSAAKIRPRGYTSTTKQSPIASLGRKNGSPILSPNKFVGSATKTLFIKPNSLTPKPKTRLVLTNGTTNGNTPVAVLENGRHGSPVIPTQEIATLKAVESSKVGTPSLNGDKSPGLDLYKQVIGSPDASGGSPNPVSPVNAAKHLVPRLTKRGYDVYPSMDVLEAMSEAELATVRGFKVERPGFGSVAWDGAVDVREVDIDAEIVIESKNVSVYDEAETSGNKPERGSKLNRPAVITMYGIFPKDGAEASAEAKEKLSRKIEKTTQKMKAELLSFESESGVWKFRVGHFSRYGLDDSDDESDDEEVTTPLLELEEKELGGTSNLRAPMDEDESTAYTDASDMLDVMGEETLVHEIIREGEMAYAMMTEEVLGSPDEEAIIPYDASQEDEKLLFPDETEDVIVSTKEEPLKPKTCPPHHSSSSGICSRLAAKSGISYGSSSNIDYGLRMRRSFRVGWRPDGSFVHLQPSSSGKRLLVQSKPAVHQGGPSLVTLPLLETHQKHSESVDETDDEAPLFTLPASNEALCNVLDDYSQSSTFCQLSDATKQTVSNAFSLLTSLYGEDGIDDTRRLQALSTWLKGVVSDATLKDISAAETVGNTHAAIFAALAGGDTALASSIALETGNYRLSLLLANSGTQSQSFFEQQLKFWNKSGAQPIVASDLLRIFSLASGSADVEKTMFNASAASYNIDWRRRFGMYLWSCPHTDAKVSVVVEKYNADVLAKEAPAATSVSGESMCVLYQMLNHYISTDTPVSSILAPISHTPFRHDFSSSFHLGAALSAASGSNVSLQTESLVIDAIASQLIAEGSWEWAVYVTLCLIDRRNASESTIKARRIHAKAIVSRFYSSNDPSAQDRREFLQSMGVPPAWFFESAAYRAQNDGDLFGLVENLKKVSLKDCLVAVESFLIPHMILEGTDACVKLRTFLQALSSIASEDYRSYWERPFGIGSIYNFLILVEKVDKLSRKSVEEIVMHSDEIDALLQAATDLDSMLTSKSTDQSHLLAKIPHQIVLAPTNIVQAEIIAQLYLLRMQLVAIKNGQPLKVMTTHPSSRSQYALSSGFFAESILRELAST